MKVTITNMKIMETRMSFCEKMVTSFAVWFGTFTLGLCCGLLGPSLVQLSIKFESDVATVSKVFTFQIFSCLVGALAFGYIFNYVNRQLASAAILILMGISNMALPLVPTLPIFFAVAIFSGIAWAGYDTSQTVWMIELWAGDAAAYIQTQHFSFALGVFVSPLIVEYCLADDLVLTDPVTSSSVNTVAVIDPQPTTAKVSPLLWVPFAVAGTVSIISGLIILILYKIKKYDKSRVFGNGELTEMDIRSQHIEDNLALKWTVIIVSGLFLGVYMGTEVSAFQFLPAFSHFIDLRLTSAQGASVVSTLAAAFTVGRGLGIFIVFKIVPEILLPINLLIVLAGNCTLMYANTSQPALYAAAVLLGLGFSTIYAGVFGLLEKYLEIGNIVGAILIAIGMFLTSLYPLFIGTFIEKTPYVLVNTLFFNICVGSILFAIILRLVRKPRDGSRFGYCIPLFRKSGSMAVTST